MQQQQQQQGVQSHFGVAAAPPPVSTSASAAAAAPSMTAEAAGAGAVDHASQHVVEEASPISSRPPAGGAISTVNLDELMTLSGAAADVAADQGGSGGGGGGNRWPRQETLALLKIRSEMDVAFRDATLKGPLWEDVSRKLAELGYKRNAKKCKEKFENVHKYYKRTKEGRAGRQDGKSYKFFSELEALHGSPPPTANVSAPPSVHVTTAAPAPPPPIVSSSIGFGSISSPVPISSFLMTPGTTTTSSIPVLPSQSPATITAMPSSQPPPAAAPMDINFSSNSSSTSHGDDYDDDDVAGEPSSTSFRKRKRGTSSSRDGGGGGGGTRRMMEFFEILMKQVMQKQETMQQRFLEVIEKREQDRNIREEAWKRQEMARLTREHELMTQERAISASRDAAIVAFLQKITGQTIQLPPPLNVHNAPPQPVPPSVSVQVSAAMPPPQQQVHHQQQQQQTTPNAQIVRHQMQPNPTDALVVAPEKQLALLHENVVGSGGGLEAATTSSSSRWPKAEVLALIKLRSGLETRYQEAGPKGPLWEEISAGMNRMGYKRNPKRCKEKWENINKYFKKVKESNKARPEDAKTCPYFHELDALYRKRTLGGGGSSGAALGNQSSQQQQQPPPPQQLKLDSATQGTPVPAPPTQRTVADQGTNLQKNLFGDGPEEAAKKPEDIVKELMGQQQQQHNHNAQHVLNQQQQQQGAQQLVVEDYDRVEEGDSDINLDQDEEEEDDDEEDDEEEDEEMDGESRKMDYKIEYQKQQNTGPSSNGGGNGAPSFLAMVQ